MANGFVVSIACTVLYSNMQIGITTFNNLNLIIKVNEKKLKHNDRIYLCVYDIIYLGVSNISDIDILKIKYISSS